MLPGGMRRKRSWQSPHQGMPRYRENPHQRHTKRAFAPRGETASALRMPEARRLVGANRRALKQGHECQPDRQIPHQVGHSEQHVQFQPHACPAGLRGARAATYARGRPSGREGWLKTSSASAAPADEWLTRQRPTCRIRHHRSRYSLGADTPETQARACLRRAEDRHPTPSQTTGTPLRTQRRGWRPRGDGRPASAIRAEADRACCARSVQPVTNLRSPGYFGFAGGCSLP